MFVFLPRAKQEAGARMQKKAALETAMAVQNRNEELEKEKALLLEEMAQLKQQLAELMVSQKPPLPPIRLLPPGLSQPSQGATVPFPPGGSSLEALSALGLSATPSTSVGRTGGLLSQVASGSEVRNQSHIIVNLNPLQFK